MAKKTLDRRTVLKGVLATGATVSIPLPLLEIMLNGNGTALAQTGQRRFRRCSSCGSSATARFRASGSRRRPGPGRNWELAPSSWACQALKSYLTVISGLTNKLVVGGREHPTGSAGATTGAPLNGNAVTAASIDQVVAELDLHRSALQVDRGGGDARDARRPAGLAGHGFAQGAERARTSRITIRSPSSPVCSAGTHDDRRRRHDRDQATKLANVRKSVLDAVLTDGANLQKKLGSADKQRWNSISTSIRAIERAAR